MPACDVVLRPRPADEILNFRGPDLIVIVLDQSTGVEELSKHSESVLTFGNDVLGQGAGDLGEALAHFFDRRDVQLVVPGAVGDELVVDEVLYADFRGRPTCLFRTQCFPEIARFSLNFSAFEVRVMSPV
jgi:hypothetical protein